MKKYTMLVLLVVGVHAGFAQVVINLQLPAMGLTLKSQLWNFSVVNTTNQDMQAQVQVLVTNVSNNQKILSGTTRLLNFPRGLKQIQANDVKPVTYNVLSPGAGVDASPEGFLPIGVFDICYSIQKRENDHYEQVAEECITVQVEPLSPPQLSYPADNDLIDITRPVFTWLPPVPINAFNYLTYNYTLVEVQSIQSSSDAIQQNIPLAAANNITPANFQYPLSLPELDTGKLYAWQISARSGGNTIANSEIWTFKVKKPGPDNRSVKPQNTYYIKFKQTIDGSYATCKGILMYEYNNEWNDKEVQLKLFDISTATRQQLTLDSSIIQLQYGQNLKQLDFGSGSLLIEKHMYLLEIVNSKNEHWYLKMEYRKPD